MAHQNNELLILIMITAVTSRIALKVTGNKKSYVGRIDGSLN